MEEENEILGPDQSWSPEMLFTPSVEEEEEEEEELNFFEKLRQAQLDKQQEELDRMREEEIAEQERIKAEEAEKERTRNVGTILNPYSGVAVEAADAVEELVGDEFREEFSKIDPNMQMLSYQFLKPGQQPSDDVKLGRPSLAYEGDQEPYVTGDFYLEYFQIQEQIKNIDKALEKVQSFMDPRYAVLTTEKDRLKALLEPLKEKSAKEKKKAEEKFFSTGEQAWIQLGKNIDSTVLTNMSNLLSVPDAVVTFFATMDPMYGGLTEEELEKVNKLSPEKRMEYLSNRTGFADILSSIRNERNKIDKGVEELNKTIYQFDEGIGETYAEAFKKMKNGELGEGWEDAMRAISRTSSAGLAQFTNFLQAAIPYVGLTSIGIGSAAGELKEVQDESYEAKRLLDQLSVTDPDYDTKRKELEKIIEKGDIGGKLIGHSTVVGAAEIIFEKFSAKVLKGAFKDLVGAPKPVMDKALRVWGLNLVKDAGGEGLSETGTLLLQKASEYFVLGDEEAFVGTLQEFVDNFIIGTAAGGQIKAFGSTPGLIQQLAVRNKVNKILEKNNVSTLDQAFNIVEQTLPEVPSELKFPAINEAQIELSQIPGVKEAIDSSVDTKIKSGELTTEQGNEIKVNFRDTQSAVNQLKPIGLNLNTEAVGLIIEKKKLEDIIKQVNDKAVTQSQQTRVDEINNTLSELAVEAEAQTQAQSIIPGQVVEQAQDLIQKAAGVKNIVDPDLGVSLPAEQTVDDSTDGINETLLETIKDPNADQATKNQAQQALIDNNTNLYLEAVRFSTDAGTIPRAKVLEAINSRLGPIINNFDPAKGVTWSTYVTNSLRPKMQEIYAEAGIGQRGVSLDVEGARQVADTEVEADVVQEIPQRAKVYPASLEVITENITPEVRSEQTVKIKDDINRAVATESTSPKAVAKSIVKQTQTPAYRKLIKDKLGKWNSDQYNNNVDRLVTKEFIATIPIAQIKRRFGKLFNIQQTGTTPTTKIENGKRTDFKKPVYKIPAITDAQLEAVKDYFKSTLKNANNHCIVC